MRGYSTTSKDVHTSQSLGRHKPHTILFSVPRPQTVSSVGPLSWIPLHCFSQSKNVLSPEPTKPGLLLWLLLIWPEKRSSAHFFPLLHTQAITGWTALPTYRGLTQASSLSSQAVESVCPPKTDSPLSLLSWVPSSSVGPPAESPPGSLLLGGGTGSGASELLFFPVLTCSRGCPFPFQDTSSHVHTSLLSVSGFKTPKNTLVVRTGLLAGCCCRSSELEAWWPHMLLLLPEDTPLTFHHPAPVDPVFSPLTGSRNAQSPPLCSWLPPDHCSPSIPLSRVLLQITDLGISSASLSQGH